MSYFRKQPPPLRLTQLNQQQKIPTNPSKTSPFQRPRISPQPRPKVVGEIMLQGENSMQQLLNSSINQFTKYLSDRDESLQQSHQQLVAQNKDLRKTLGKLKTIIKQKLVSALSKQRQELNAVMEDYVQLITKLLVDKEELTTRLEQTQILNQQLKKQNEQLITANEQIITRESQLENQVKELNTQKDVHIDKTKKQIDQFLQIIEQYEEEADQEVKINIQLQNKIQQLQHQLAKHQMPPPKTQALLDLLEKAQEENRQLRQELCSQSWSDRLATRERQHQQQFIEYGKVMRETIAKKDQQIIRLTAKLQALKEKKERKE